MWPNLKKQLLHEMQGLLCSTQTVLIQQITNQRLVIRRMRAPGVQACWRQETFGCFRCTQYNELLFDVKKIFCSVMTQMNTNDAIHHSGGGIQCCKSTTYELEVRCSYVITVTIGHDSKSKQYFRFCIL